MVLFECECGYNCGTQRAWEKHVLRCTLAKDGKYKKIEDTPVKSRPPKDETTSAVKSIDTSKAFRERKRIGEGPLSQRKDSTREELKPGDGIEAKEERKKVILLSSGSPAVTTQTLPAIFQPPLKAPARALPESQTTVRRAVKSSESEVASTIASNGTASSKVADTAATKKAASQAVVVVQKMLKEIPKVKTLEEELLSLELKLQTLQRKLGEESGNTALAPVKIDSRVVDVSKVISLAPAIKPGNEKQEAPLAVGDTVKVVVNMESDCKEAYTLPVGLLGCVLKLDEEGDALIDFHDIPQSTWIYAKQMHNLINMTKQAGKIEKPQSHCGCFAGISTNDVMRWLALA